MNDPDRAVSVWREKDLYEEHVTDALVIILNTTGCIFKGRRACTMCGYVNDSSPVPVSSENLRHQIVNALQAYHNEEVVKIYTSGSFLERNEVPLDLRQWILEQFSSSKKFVVETRPEFVNDAAVKDLVSSGKKIYFAIGLETSSDSLRRLAINKSFSLLQFERKADLIHRLGGFVKTYLMLKPPFTSEYYAIEDTVRSIKEIAPYSDEISVNPTNIQKHTVAEKLFYDGSFRPPWLWSVVEVLKRTSDMEIPIISKPSGAGTYRGAHNCFKCDNTVLNAIEQFVFYGNNIFDEISCPCHEQWKIEREISKYKV